MIDLHTHTTASDGRDTPAELVARAAAAGVSVLAVTDHDTVAGCEAAATAAAAAGIGFVDGIEITALRAGGDVHLLGYFFDRHSPALLVFLQQQRLQRIERVREMVARLAANGIALNADAIVQPAIENPAKSAGRPWIARALVAAGVVADANEAFAKWLSRGRPGYVPRAAASPPKCSRGFTMPGDSRRWRIRHWSDRTAGSTNSQAMASMRSRRTTANTTRLRRHATSPSRPG